MSEWHDVPGWPGFAVTAEGEIRGPSGRTLRPMSTDTGHLYVTAGPKSRKLYVHRAVLLTFVGPPAPGQETRHENGVPTDNRRANLCWGTKAENAADRIRHSRQPRGESAGTAKLTLADVLEIRRLHGTQSLRALGARFGVSHTAVRRAALGMKWRHVDGE